MELKRLLEQANWDEAPFAYEADALDRLLRARVESGLRRVLRHHRGGLALNLALMLLSLGLYLFDPSSDRWLPVALLVGALGVNLLQSWRQVRRLHALDPSQDLRHYLAAILAQQRRLHRQLARTIGWTLAASCSGGFLLGLMWRGWDLAKIADHPVVWLIGAGLAAGMLLLARSQAFREAICVLNPGYRQAQAYLEEQYAALEEGDG